MTLIVIFLINKNCKICTQGTRWLREIKRKLSGNNLVTESILNALKEFAEDYGNDTYTLFHKLKHIANKLSKHPYNTLILLTSFINQFLPEEKKKEFEKEVIRFTKFQRFSKVIETIYNQAAK